MAQTQLARETSELEKEYDAARGLNKIWVGIKLALMPIHFALVAPTCCGSGRASRREARARDPIDFHDLLEEAVEGRIPGGVLSLLREEALDCNPCRGEGDPGEPHHYIWCLRERSG